MAYTPAKLIQINMTNLGANATYDYDDGTGDPWIGFPYRWNVNLAISTQQHSNHTTSPTPFFYDGLNVNIGDYICTSGDGIVVKIISITSQSSSAVECVVEDVDRSNLFQDPTQTGTGIGPDGEGYLFEVIDGMPILFPIPLTLAGSLTPYFASNILSKFLKDKTPTNITVDQIAHGFTVGQAIYLQSDGSYALANASSLSTAEVIGYVTEVGVPGPDRFKYRPIGPYIRIPMPAGNPGDVVYLSDSSSGELTTTEPSSNSIKLFIKIDANSGIIINRRDTVTTPGSGLLTYYAEAVGGGSNGPLLVTATGLNVEYSKPAAGSFIIHVPVGIELSSAKINLAQADTATLNSVPFALDITVRYLDGSRNTDIDTVNCPTVSIIDKSVIALGGSQPTLSTPFLYKPLGNSISVQVHNIQNNAGVGEATFRVQQLNFDYCTLVLNF